MEELLKTHEQASQFLETPAVATDSAVEQTISDQAGLKGPSNSVQAAGLGTRRRGHVDRAGDHESNRGDCHRLSHAAAFVRPVGGVCLGYRVRKRAKWRIVWTRVPETDTQRPSGLYGSIFRIHA